MTASFVELKNVKIIRNYLPLELCQSDSWRVTTLEFLGMGALLQGGDRKTSFKEETAGYLG